MCLLACGFVVASGGSAVFVDQPVQHPLNVNLREDAVIGRVNKWLAREFAPRTT
jgi:hypothetical protein